MLPITPSPTSPNLFLLVLCGSGQMSMEQLADVAFRTADGKIVLVLSNTSNFPTTVNVRYHGKVFTTTLPEESVGTYVW